MPEDYFKLSEEERREALGVASTESGRPIHLLEKDIWVVWTLRQLYESDYAEHLVFKGGTSLSKAHHAIHRFSEDIDITYDIRVIAGDLVEKSPDGLPQNQSQQRKWTDAIRARLTDWVAEKILPYLQERLSQTDSNATASATEHKINIEYRPIGKGNGYVAPSVQIDFGARSTGEPSETLAVVTDAAAYLKDISFPECTVRAMRAERTFWEKATAIHVFCLQHKLNGERYARHWYDLVQLNKVGIVDRALKDRDLAKAVAEHKSVFFLEKDTNGALIDYRSAVAGKLRLVPDGEARKLLSDDYNKMLEDGLLPDDAETFEAIMAKCAQIEAHANQIGR